MYERNDTLCAAVTCAPWKRERLLNQKGARSVPAHPSRGGLMFVFSSQQWWTL
jgi:hypothetical protein